MGDRKIAGGSQIRSREWRWSGCSCRDVQHAMFRLFSFMCFGRRLDDVVIGDIEKVERDVILMLLECRVIDLMPIGKILFWNRWNRFLAVIKRQEDIMIPVIRARKEEDPKQKNLLSYVDTLLDPEEGGRKLNNSEMTSLCLELFSTGTDTTTPTIEWTVANLVKRHHVQQRLYEEIAGVMKKGEEINGDDLQKMPYLRAVILEGLRLHPPAHFLPPHVISEDTVLEGYVLPRGTMVNFAVKEMGRDGSVWEDPLTFRPERFLEGSDGGSNGDVMVNLLGCKEINMMPFGAGWRICPGINVAVLHLG